MKVLLNNLPPADINSPSISLSILKSFMLKHKISTEILYWNFDLSLMEEFTQADNNEIDILPFISIINDRFNNSAGNKRILSLLQQIDPSLQAINSNYYSELLEEKKNCALKTIKERLETIDFSEFSLIGFTAKNNQFFPAIIVAQEIKNLAPDVKIVIGGFGSNDEAREAMKHGTCFDFATWGEGEYPLLHLVNELSANNTNFTKVPRLMIRTPNGTEQSITNKSEYLDFKNYIFPNYQDFIEQHPDFDDDDKINFPINTIRSCNWSKCKFCDFNAGYRLRSRSPKCIVNEIEQLTNLYECTTFSFVDSDTFGNEAHFEELLDRIIALKTRSDKDFQFWSEIIPNSNFSPVIFNKMAIAGFKNVFIGYDGLSDRLLTKMNKSNSFADNIFFVKQAIDNGINPLVNVIKGIPNETEDDVRECMKNLHYLRFLYSDTTISFHHTFVSLVLSSKTKYYTTIPDAERIQYNTNSLSYLLPENFSDNTNRFHLFRYKKAVLPNKIEWNKLIDVEKHYRSSNYSYNTQQINNIVYYTEYCNGEEIAQITFEELEYVHILKTTNQKVYTFTELFAKMTNEFSALTEDKLKTILNNLQNDFLIYCNSDYSEIVSVINIR